MLLLLNSGSNISESYVSGVKECRHGGTPGQWGSSSAVADMTAALAASPTADTGRRHDRRQPSTRAPTLTTAKSRAKLTARTRRDIHMWSKEGKVADRCGERPSPREARPPPHVRHAQHPSYCRALARAIAHDPQAQSRPTEHTHPPKIPQKDRGYARYSRCGLAEVRQFTYLLTNLGHRRRKR